MTCDVCPDAFEPSSFSSGEGLEKRADLLAHELAERWRKGERPGAEEYLDRHAELRAYPVAATRLIYEEFCQRRERGERPARSEYLERFAEWRQSLEILFECEEIVERESAGPRYPSPG